MYSNNTYYISINMSYHQSDKWWPISHFRPDLSSVLNDRYPAQYTPKLGVGPIFINRIKWSLLDGFFSFTVIISGYYRCFF